MVISGRVELLFNFFSSKLGLPNADTALQENIRWCCSQLSHIESNVFLSRKEMYRESLPSAKFSSKTVNQFSITAGLPRKSA